MRLTICPICKSPDLSLFFEKTVEGKTYRVDLCAECGVFFVNPQPTDEELMAVYQDSYFTERSYESKEGYRLSIARKRLSVVSRVMGGLEGKGVLEIGAAMGHFLKVARDDFGCQVRGVELSSYAAQRARELYDVEVFAGMLERSPFLTDKYDLICGWDLFEHLKDPEGFLNTCRSLLTDTGILIIHIPFTGSPVYKLRGSSWRKINPVEHLFYYNYEGIRILAERTGFEIVRAPFSLLGITDFIFNDTRTFYLKKI